MTDRPSRVEPLNPSAWSDERLAAELRASKSLIAAEAARRIEAFGRTRGDFQQDAAASAFALGKLDVWNAIWAGMNPKTLPATPELVVDPSRYDDTSDPTGIYVRARYNGNWGNYDIAYLTAASLRDFLRSRGGSNPWAEETVFAIFGHPVIGTSPNMTRIPA